MAQTAQQTERGRIVWHELMTKDPKAAEPFYKHVVGWTTSPYEGNKDYTMWMAGENPAGGLMAMPPEAEEMGAPPNWLTYIAVPDVDETSEQAEKQGASVLAPARSIEGVGRFAVLRDPQGAVFAVITGEGESPPESDPKARGLRRAPAGWEP